VCPAQEQIEPGTQLQTQAAPDRIGTAPAIAAAAPHAVAVISSRRDSLHPSRSLPIEDFSGSSDVALCTRGEFFTAASFIELSLNWDASSDRSTCRLWRSRRTSKH